MGDVPASIRHDVSRHRRSTSWGWATASEARLRSFTQRVADLDEVIDLLAIDRSRPLFLAAHDWGGAIAMGWAVDHVDELRRDDPVQHRHRGASGTLGAGTHSPRWLATDFANWCATAHRSSSRAPCGSRGSASPRSTAKRSGRRTARHARRSAIADFVGDIPLQPGSPSEAALAAVADRLGTVTAPVLLVWGAATRSSTTTSPATY